MADAFQAARTQAAAAKQRDFAMYLDLPEIPLWVPEQAKRQLGGLIQNSIHLALQDAAGYISDEAPRSEGILAQSFTADPANSKGGIEVIRGTTVDDISGRVFSSLPYAIVMDQGRRPGAPISRAGIEAIGLWAQRKLGLGAEEAGRAKWAIARSIVNQGIAGTDYFGIGVDKARPRIEQLFRILADQITAALVSEGGRQAG